MKTIEEAATDYKSDIEGSDRERQAAYDGFIDGASHIKSLPPSERLTDEERMKIRNIYDVVYPQCPDIHPLTMCITAALEFIFGKDLFAEKGDKK